MQNKLIIETAQEVIKIELNGINKLSRLINLNFANIVSKLAKVKGKVIITGIGKSGHIARKISSTMSSTGTQSHFCHSTEMSHGDLGIISKNDVVIIISNSGSSTELNGVINFCKKNNIFTIGMSSLKNSNLMNSVNMGLIIPSSEEACIIGMAPTTSTTMALVLGDAICISLMKMKKFSTKNYRNIHPGGSLGENLIQVKKIMHTGSKIPLIDENASMKDAVIEITRKAFGHVGVLNKSKKLIGIITDGDLRRSINNNLLEKKVKYVMKKNPFFITEEELAVTALKLMNSKKISCLFIEKKNMPIGIIHMHDCLKISAL